MLRLNFRRYRYNYDPAELSGESSGLDDFIEEEFDYIDESSYVTEDSNISTDPERKEVCSDLALKHITVVEIVKTFNITIMDIG